MKTWLSILGMTVLTTSLLQAHSILPTKPIPLPDPIPPILFPNGQSLLIPTCEVGISYLGGNAGQVENRVGTSGVISPRSTSGPSQGQILTAPLPWVNGFELNIVGSTAGLGFNTIALNYSILTGNSSTSTVTSDAANPNILPAFALNNATGETNLVVGVSSTYSMPTFQDATLTFSKSLLMNPYLSVMFITGLHGFALNHTLNVQYTDTSTGLTSLTMQEISYGAGPLVGFITSKKFTEGFALRGVFAASAPLSNNSLTQSDSYLLDKIKTYGYNTKSTAKLSQYFVAHLDLELVFRTMHFLALSVDTVLAWHVKQYLNISYLTAMSNNQNAAPSTIQTDTVRLGILFTF